MDEKCQHLPKTKKYSLKNNKPRKKHTPTTVGVYPGYNLSDSSEFIFPLLGKH